MLSNFKNNKLHSSSEDIAVFKTKYEDFKPVHQVTAKCETTIPPRNETIVLGIINEDNNFRYGLIQYPSIDESVIRLLMPSSLVDLSRKMKPVRIVNASDNARVIKGAKVSVTCALVTYADRNYKATIIAESYDVMVVKSFRVQN